MDDFRNVFERTGKLPSSTMRVMWGSAQGGEPVCVGRIPGRRACLCREEPREEPREESVLCGEEPREESVFV